MLRPRLPRTPKPGNAKAAGLNQQSGVRTAAPLAHLPAKGRRPRRAGAELSSDPSLSGSPSTFGVNGKPLVQFKMPLKRQSRSAPPGPCQLCGAGMS